MILTINTMFAYLRSQCQDQDTSLCLATKMPASLYLATKMRDNVRNQMSPLSDIDHSEFTVSLAEIYMREFACMLQTLKQVNWIATKHHEHAFDNMDAYIEDQQQQQQPHEMTGEQRHASQLLLGVGNSYSEINTALRMLGCGILMRDVMECDSAKIGIVAENFQINPSIMEDAFDRLHHIIKHVWTLVNRLAFSNLFRFADPNQPIFIANQDDAIFIPYIPMQ